MQNLEKVAYARNCPDAGSLIEHTGRQDLFVEAHIDELETLLELAMLQDAVASNRSIEYIQSLLRIVCIDISRHLNFLSLVPKTLKIAFSPG